MDGVDRETALRVEKVRMLLDYAGKEFESHRQYLLIAFAALLGAGLTAAGSMALERLAASFGIPFAAVMFAGAIYVHAGLRMLPRRLRRVYRQGTRIIDTLMNEEEE